MINKSSEALSVTLNSDGSKVAPPVERARGTGPGQSAPAMYEVSGALCPYPQIRTAPPPERHFNFADSVPFLTCTDSSSSSSGIDNVASQTDSDGACRRKPAVETARRPIPSDSHQSDERGEEMRFDQDL